MKFPILDSHSWLFLAFISVFIGLWIFVAVYNSAWSNTKGEVNSNDTSKIRLLKLEPKATLNIDMRGNEQASKLISATFSDKVKVNSSLHGFDYVNKNETTRVIDLIHDDTLLTDRQFFTVIVNPSNNTELRNGSFEGFARFDYDDRGEHKSAFVKLVLTLKEVGIIPSNVAAREQPNNRNGTTLQPGETKDGKIDGNSSKFLQYKNSDLGFTIDYPSNWQKDTANVTNHGLVAFYPHNADVAFDVKLLPRINSQSLKTFGDNHFKKNKKLNIVEFGSTTFVGQPAVRVVGTFIYSPTLFEQLRHAEPSNETILAMTTLLKQKNGFLEIMFYAANKSLFDDNLPMAKHMVDSFQMERVSVQKD
jgi:hypothetical protein